MTTWRLRDADIQRLALCKVGANRQRIFLMKSDEDGHEERVMPVARLIKAADDWSTAYVPVAVPGAKEGQGIFATADGDTDVWDTEDEIAKAAHSFMANGAQVVGEHFTNEQMPGAKLVENAVALADFEVGSEKIAKGTWYVGLEFDPHLRQEVSAGNIDAVSVEGFATRIAKDAIHQDTGADYSPYSDRGDSGDKVNLDRIERMVADESRLLLDVMAWCEGRGWAESGETPTPTEPVAKQIREQLAKDAILVPDKPGARNWIDRTGTGDLPKFIGDIAGDLISERGKTTGQAIELAVGIVRNWCHGKGNVTAKTRAKACAASSEWEAKKAQAHASSVAKGGTLEDVEAEHSGLLAKIAKALGVRPDDDAEHDPECDCHTWTVDDDLPDPVEAEQIAKAKLAYKSRKALPKSAFAIPEKAPGSGSYPIHDRSHAANALSRASGKPEESKVRAAVCRRHPDMPACKKSKMAKALDGESGNVEDVELGERVEKLESSLEELNKKLIGSEEEPGMVAKIAAKLDGGDGKEPAKTGDGGKDGGDGGDDGKQPVAKTRADWEKEIDKIAEEFAGKLEPIAKAIDELSEGQSAQAPADAADKNGKQPVAKEEPLAGILFD